MSVASNNPKAIPYLLTEATSSSLNAIEIDLLFDFSKVTPSALKLMDPTAFAKLDLSQIRQISEKQASVISIDQLNALSQTQVLALSPVALSGLQNSVIECYAHINYFSTLKTLNPFQVGALTASQIASLSLAQIHMLNAAGLTNAQLGYIDGSNQYILQDLSFFQVGDLTRSQIASLSLAQIHMLNAAGLTNAQLGYTDTDNRYILQDLSSSQVGALTDSTIAGLTIAQLAFKDADNRYILQDLRSAQVASLTIATISQLTIAQLGYTDADNRYILQDFTATQIAELPLNIISKLTYAQLTYSVVGSPSCILLSLLSDVQIASLTRDQLQGLNGDLIQSLSLPQAAALTVAQLLDKDSQGNFIAHDLTSLEVSQLSDYQINGLPASRVQMLDSSGLGYSQLLLRDKQGHYVLEDLTKKQVLNLTAQVKSQLIDNAQTSELGDAATDPARFNTVITFLKAEGADFKGFLQSVTKPSNTQTDFSSPSIAQFLDAAVDDYIAPSLYDTLGHWALGKDLTPWMSNGQRQVSDSSIGSKFYQDGMMAQTFMTSEGQLIISYEGTFGTTMDTNAIKIDSTFLGNQYKADGYIFANQVAPAEQDAVEYAAQVINLAKSEGISTSKIFLTGHSLGGILAEYTAQQTGLGGIGFDDTGIPSPSTSSQGDGSNFINILTYGDPVSSLCSELGENFSDNSTPQYHYGQDLFIGNSLDTSYPSTLLNSMIDSNTGLTFEAEITKERNDANITSVQYQSFLAEIIPELLPYAFPYHSPSVLAYDLGIDLPLLSAQALSLGVLEGHGGNLKDAQPLDLQNSSISQALRYTTPPTFVSVDSNRLL